MFGSLNALVVGKLVGKVVGKVMGKLVGKPAGKVNSLRRKKTVVVVDNVDCFGAFGGVFSRLIRHWANKLRHSVS